MSARDRRDDDIEDRLDELADVLSDLRRDLRETERDRRGPSGTPRPPRLSELVRFTEQYTIPTVIALLETTITSLELLQGTLRLADPERSVAEGAASTGDRLASVRDGATAGLSRSLAELRTALSEADLPEDAASKSIIADARDLTAEIESRIDENRRAADAKRGSSTGRDRREGDAKRGSSTGRDRREGDTESDTGKPVQIDVTDPDAESEDVDDRGTAEEASTGPEVDVESELESIKRQVDGEGADESGDEGDVEGGRASETDGNTGEDESGTD
ncbi:hypothetical protein [Halorubrum sp. BV1]|uniref:DUF7547 family protein n=1 Tax=Halorubrum sp. BV1 TaxID=1498500 RepID=UPI0006792B0D|nr:hypothetical protein [Halorubrum sp. BV1]